MINNICENTKNNKSIQQAVVTTNVHKRHNDIDEDNNIITNAGQHQNRGNTGGGVGVVQTTYGNGIWYSEIIDSVSNTNNKNNNNNNIKPMLHKQQYYNNANSNNNNNNNENIVNRNVWSTTRNDVVKEQQKQKQQQQQPKQTSSNECDIIIVDIEDEDNYDAEDKAGYQQSPATFNAANLKYSQKPTTNIDNSAIPFLIKTNIAGNVNTVTTAHRTNDRDHVNTNNDNDVDRIEELVDDEEEDDDDEDEEDSLASMETLSDNVSIWIDGEKHWVAGVDANTTCSDLIWALLNYQNAQHTHSHKQRQTQQQHEENIATTVINQKQNNNQNERHNDLQHKQQQHHQQQQQQNQPNVYDKTKNIEFSLSMKDSCNIPNISNNTQFTIPSSNVNATNKYTTSPITTSINQSMPINTKENYKIIPNSSIVTPTISAAIPSASSSTIISSSAPVPGSILPPSTTLLPLTLPPGISTVSQLATEYVIVKQYHHCEEYLDGSTKVFDVLPPRDGLHKKQCELLLRHLGPAPAVYINNTTPQLSSLISTDKDSGMGSPVGSARSAKFRRRKHKSSQWLAQANTLHPKLSRCMGNERLMKIILAQDETIQRQLSLLREKERQITKIEEEKHRKRERELGKNYLLETYLNGLDEAECEPEIQDGEEIFIDEPYQRTAATTTTITAAAPLLTATTNPRTTITPTGVPLAAGAVTDKIPSAAEAFNMMAKHKLKDKDVKKEKKKKRHKEKSTKDEGIPVKDFNLKTNKNKDKEKEKEKVDKQHQQHQHHHHYELNGAKVIKDNDNEQEIEMQILWLEKIYTLNKQLQKEEELAAKLHAKVRKHQLRKAQQTQQEVQMEIDKLDNNLALQCGDIRKVEANLMQTNEQLQKKLLILERLSIEYLQEQQEKDNHCNKEALKDNAERQRKDLENPLKNDANTLLTNLTKSIDIQKLSLNNIKSKEEVIKLEKIIAKPSIEMKEAKNTLTTTTAATINEANNPLRVNMKTTATTSYPQVSTQQHNQRFSHEIRENTINDATNTNTQRNVIVRVTNNQQTQQQHQQQHSHVQQPNQSEILNPSSLVTSTNEMALSNSNSNNNTNNDTMSTSCLFIDKNMLSSLHVQNAKTIKKQMFHTQTSATAPLIGKIPTISSSSSAKLLQNLHPPPTTSSTTSSSTFDVTNAFPKQQFQHILQQQQHMPMSSTFLTSRPQNLHQMPSTNIVLVQQPTSSTVATSSSISSYTLNTNLTTSTSSSPLTSSSLGSALTLPILNVPQPPPISASPSPSIMAMNTVDISQLGTLV